MEPPENLVPRGRSLGRYVLYVEFAIGGMATVHFGRLRGQGGFSRTVAVKRLHAAYARDPHFVSLLVEEARLAARVQHPNVVAPLDVVAVDDCELLLIMEYVHGEALSRLLGACARRGVRVAPAIAVSVMAGVLYGLHAAHEAVSDAGEPLHIVHRDVSPQNILVGVDGAARVLDFGVAKASSRSHGTEPGVAKGKLAYMAPEQLRGKEIDRRADLFAAGVVLWEMLTLRRLFRSDEEGTAAAKVLKAEVPPPSHFNPQVTEALDQVVFGALARHKEVRYPTALDFAAALEQAVAPASTREVGQWVQTSAHDSLGKRAQLRASIESASLRDSGAMQVLSVTAASVPAPEDESVTVRATPSQLRAAAGGAPMRRLVPPPRPAESEPSGPYQPVSLLDIQEERAAEDELPQLSQHSRIPDDNLETTQADARIPVEELDEDAAEIERALATIGPVDEPVPQRSFPPMPAERLFTPEPSVRRPTLSGVFDVLSRRSWFQVPNRVWGALGMTAFAAALALVIILPSRSQPPPTRGRPAAAQVAIPAAVTPLDPPAPDPQVPAPHIEELQVPVVVPQVPVVPVHTAQNDEPPAPESARVRPEGLFGKVHASTLARRRFRAKNRPVESATSASCSPPYVLDERGIRRIRPECLAVP
jgi:serine/threonine-protein kinase